MLLTREELLTAFHKIRFLEPQDWLNSQVPKQNGDLGYTIESMPDMQWYGQLVVHLALFGTLPHTKVTETMAACLQAWSAYVSTLPASTARAALDDYLRVLSVEYVPFPEDDAQVFCHRIFRSNGFFSFPSYFGNWTQKQNPKADHQQVLSAVTEVANIIGPTVIATIGLETLLEALADTMAPTITEGAA